MTATLIIEVENAECNVVKILREGTSYRMQIEEPNGQVVSMPISKQLAAQLYSDMDREMENGDTLLLSRNVAEVQKLV